MPYQRYISVLHFHKATSKGYDEAEEHTQQIVAVLTLLVQAS
jgi:hypothetical protein